MLKGNLAKKGGVICIRNKDEVWKDSKVDDLVNCKISLVCCRIFRVKVICIK